MIVARRMRDAVMEAHAILVVDEETVRAYVHKILSMRGYQVLDADRVSVPGLPPLPTVINEPAPVEAASEPLFDELERIGA